MDRFPREDNIFSYAGLLPRIYQSGSREYKGYITSGGKFQKYMLVEYVQVHFIREPDSPIIEAWVAKDIIQVWSKYNSSLVKRIDVLLDTSFLDSGKDDLGKENDGKVGQPYEYPQEFFVFLSVAGFIPLLSLNTVTEFSSSLSFQL